MTEIPKQIRHGDILIEKIDNIPKGVKKKDQVLATGEVTGHAHKVFQCQVMANADQLEKNVPTNELEQYIIVEKPEAVLTHEEHGEISLDPGFYRVGHQRQFDTIGNEIRRVQD